MQSLIVALVIAAAAVFVGRRLYRFAASMRRKDESGGCGPGCGGCH